MKGIRMHLLQQHKIINGAAHTGESSVFFNQPKVGAGIIYLLNTKRLVKSYSPLNVFIAIPGKPLIKTDSFQDGTFNQNIG